MADDPLLSREVDAAGFAAIMATKPVTKLVRPVKWWLDHSFVTVDSAGTPHFAVDTSGRFTEASAAQVQTNTASTNILLEHVRSGLYFAQPTALGSDAAALRGTHAIAVVPLTSDGAGAIAATDIVPALAGYTAHARVKTIWAPSGATDASSTWTFSIAAGTILGAGPFDMNLTQLRSHWIDAGVAGVSGQGVALRGTIAADDNKAMQVAVNGLVAAVKTYMLELEYWYET